MKSLLSAGSKLASPGALLSAAVLSSVLLAAVWAAPAGAAGRRYSFAWSTWVSRLGLPPGLPSQTAPGDTGRYRPSRRPRLRTVRDRAGSRFGQRGRRSPLILPLPKSVQLQVTPDDSLKNYNVRETVGSQIDYRDPTSISQAELLKFQERQAINDYYRQKAMGGVAGAPAAPGSPQAQRLIPKIYLGPIADRIFGGSYIDIRPAGSLTLKAGAKYNVNRNPALTLRQQSVGDFIFEQNMNLSLSGQVGTKLKLVFNYDTKAAFDFDNQMKFDYAGQPTDILRKLDLGNVSMPLNNSLITGGSNLFGIKTQLQFGRLGVTAVAATLRGSQDEVRVQNGAQSRTFELKASQYEKDRHYFLSQYFRDNYDAALQGLPTVKSGFEIRRLEVWITNDNRTTADLRNVVALQDLAEPRQERLYRPQFYNGARNPTVKTPPSNKANTLFPTLTNGGAAARDNLQVESFLGSLGLVKSLDYERLRARKLQPNEYTFNAQLGYVNLNTALLPDQVLGVSYELLYNGLPYTVGETQTEYAGAQADQVIFLKMLKATNPGVGTADPTVNPANLNLLTHNTPTWDLMMKNIYPLNTSQVNRDNFQLQIIYKDDITGVDLISLKEGQRLQNVPLIQALGLDRVNANNDRNADGNFDYFPGITIDPELGKIIFPSVQPFGSYLKAQFDTLGPNATNERLLAQKYVYQALYNQTQSDAQQQQVKDKFFLRGRFQGTSTDEISLPGIGVAQGSVKVYAGSTLLTEGVDYQVFYDQAKVKILNPAYLNSANELRITFEKNALVQVQPRKLLGTRLDYALSKDVLIGATAMHILENQAPGINRVNIGDEPANNTVLGADISLRKDSRVLTKLVDRLPFLATKETSTVAFTGEVAKLIAGQSKLGNGENGVSYLDDFENARTPYTLGGLAAVPAWRLAATPAPFANSAVDGLTNGYRRAKLAWYTVDQSYYTNGPNVPAGIAGATLANHYVRGVPRNEVFPNKDLGATGNGFEYTFDLAYFPGERGPYNYTPNILSDGKRFSPAAGLPDNNFGGISRGITFDTDFDNSNVEYLEFWLMDPFLKVTNPNAPASRVNITDQDGNDAPNTTGGNLVLNLGNVSEDVLRDQGQHEFENGLPVPGDPAGTTSPTVFGRVTNQQFLLDAFNATPGARASQDIGLDGLADADERTQFAAIPGYGALADPSNDNFRHHLDPSYDANSTQILGRYKNYDNYEGNSPENSQLSSSAYPDKEDLNRDNVIQTTEQYYEYTMPLLPGQLNVGQNYITDKVTNTVPASGGDQVTWYQFRIPIRQPGRVQGNNGQPFGFKNIRFMRLYMTGWQQPVVLRMVQPQFVANQWRQYASRIADPRIQVPGIGNPTDADAFAVSTVSVEENGPSAASVSSTGAIPYVVPPNITRDVEYGSTAVSRQQNEQSLRLAVTRLRDGYGKAAYKNLTTNLLRYKRLRMYLHAEANSTTKLADGDVRAFIRIGTDYSQNYYEYSLPLVVTQPGETAQDRVWRPENSVDVALQAFIDAKATRNQQPTVSYTTPFQVFLDPVLREKGPIITIMGNPDFSQVQGCMIGVLNPAATNVGADTDTGDKSVTLWADEFRVFDFDNQGGWAANARLNVKLADLANLTATGSFIGVGFGGLQDKAQQRSTSDVLRGDLNATVAADKLLPPQLRLRVPVLVQLGRQTITPQYDPLDPDTKLEQSLQKFKNSADATAYKSLVVDRTTTRSISVLNVRKERAPTQTKTHPWDIENVAVSYAITERLHTDINTQRDYTQSYTAALAYIYQTTPRNYTPLASFKALDNPYLKIFQQINFTPLPSRFSFRTDLDRRYNERFLQRVTEPGQLPTAVDNGVFYKSFYINRIYDMNWALTKALTLDYTATNRGVIDEGVGQSLGDGTIAQNNRAEQWNNLKRGGRTTNFSQNIALTYRLPLDKFPLTDWISADTRYTAHYSWQAVSTATGIRIPANPNVVGDTTTTLANLGNTVQNNRELSANGKIDLVKLYNKVRFLNIINNAPPPAPRPAQPDPSNPNAPVATRPTPTAPDTARKDPLRFVKAVLRAVMTARSINFTYAQSSGTLLPGYLPATKYFGLDNRFGGLAPGIPFILGQQYTTGELYNLASSNNWYTQQSQYLNTPLSNILTENFTARTTLEPFRGFNIQLDLRSQKVRNNEAYYRLAIDTTSAAYLANGTLNPFADRHLANTQALGTGSYSVSTITVQTLFGDLGNNGETSKAFDRFVANRAIVQQRLQAASPSSTRTVSYTTIDPTTGRPVTTYTNQATNLYSYNSQDVLLQSFLDAYHGKSSDGYEAKTFNPFSVIPLPNWNVQYNGFSDLPGIRNVFRSFTLSHVYSSIYNLGGYTTSTAYENEPTFGPAPATPFLSNATGQVVPYYVVGQVSIIESMAPLLGLNFQTVNNVTGRVQYNTARAVSLNITNAQVTELHTTELVIGLGYAATGFKLPFRVGGEQRVLKNNLTGRLDLSIRDNATIQRSILGSVDPVPATTTVPVPGTTPPALATGSAAVVGVVGTSTSQVTNGSLQVQLRPTIDYLLNARLNLQFYFSQTITQPRVSNAFRNATTEGGIQLRYSLQ
ncbi:T9SS outer membrane translocon Sov/SprA [Hymenobacter cheonanensis]|uniref:T9SS outer membrane translocon Sov/SprA n=1 Tax=Hymenobacter sp. CA2-7 TaxID=3063993 RepID=UPI002712C3DA|nr:cell surface protein SprA [Hymenobacter sp. CA2-7]MDO7887461.1 cell surface protein SprA [Hymenobacter sp. CA2-7]